MKTLLLLLTVIIVSCTSTTPAPTPTPTPSPTPSPSPSPVVVDLCKGLKVETIDVPLSFTRTVLPFYFGNNIVVAAKFVAPAVQAGPNSYIDASVAEYQGPPTYRTATISSSPCDFRPIDKTGKNGPLAGSGGTSPQLMVWMGTSDPKIIPGQTYYLNFKNSWIDEQGKTHDACQEDTDCKASIVIVERK